MFEINPKYKEVTTFCPQCTIHLTRASFSVYFWMDWAVQQSAELLNCIWKNEIKPNGEQAGETCRTLCKLEMYGPLIKNKGLRSSELIVITINQCGALLNKKLGQLHRACSPEPSSNSKFGRTNVKDQTTILSKVVGISERLLWDYWLPDGDCNY